MFCKAKVVMCNFSFITILFETLLGLEIWKAPNFIVRCELKVFWGLIVVVGHIFVLQVRRDPQSNINKVWPIEWVTRIWLVQAKTNIFRGASIEMTWIAKILVILLPELKLLWILRGKSASDSWPIPIVQELMFTHYFLLSFLLFWDMCHEFISSKLDKLKKTFQASKNVGKNNCTYRLGIDRLDMGY